VWTQGLQLSLQQQERLDQIQGTLPHLQVADAVRRLCAHPHADNAPPAPRTKMLDKESKQLHTMLQLGQMQRDQGRKRYLELNVCRPPAKGA
jgi:hypothetical protein